MTHMYYHNRPGPSSLARPKKGQRRSPSTENEEQHDDIPKETGTKDDAVYWRYVGKTFALTHTPWLRTGDLEVACRLKNLDPFDQESIPVVISKRLDCYDIPPEVRVTKRFQSQVGVDLFWF